VQRFLGEGGRKRVYLAHDDRLDRDVAIAVIKTDGLDATTTAWTATWRSPSSKPTGWMLKG